ncbi:hypothetical protein MASR2M47_31920 [Draconibacterium sp.]
MKSYILKGKIMKKYYTKISSIIALMLLLNSCSVIGGIFKAGMGFGIFIVVAIIIGIVALIFRARK